jgi:hypothetical protein
MSDQQLASKRKRLTMDPEDDDLALSEIEAQVIRSDGSYRLMDMEVRKDDHGRVVFLRVFLPVYCTLFPSSIAKLTKLKSLRVDNVESLPKELWQLPSLKTLVVESTSNNNNNSIDYKVRGTT